MGYLQHAANELNPTGPPNFSKAVISLWFRPPSADFVAAKAQYDADIEVFPDTDFRLPGIVPLLTFGPTGEIVTSYNNLGAVTSVSPVSPCVIGISCAKEVAPDFDEVKNVMYARLQYSSGGTSVDPDTGGAVYKDYFETGASVGPFGNGSGTPIVITPDVWHHALISFDLSGGCGATLTATGESTIFTINTSCPFYWAIDDVNYTSIFTDAPANRIISAASSYQPGYDASVSGTGSFPYSFSAGAIPTSAYPIALPATGGFAERIRNVSIARFQMFTGVTLDTGVLSNRRSFITAALKPADPKLAAQLLGKSPLYRFDTAQDWLDGNNRGTAGRFTRTGTITQTTGP